LFAFLSDKRPVFLAPNAKPGNQQLQVEGFDLSSFLGDTLQFAGSVGWQGRVEQMPSAVHSVTQGGRFFLCSWRRREQDRLSQAGVLRDLVWSARRSRPHTAGQPDSRAT